MDDQVEPGTPHPEYGRLVTIKAKVAWVAGDPARPLSGKTVYFYVVPGAANRAGLTGDLPAGLESAGSKKFKLPVTTTTADGWTDEIKFYVSRYGGDTFDIFVTADPAYVGGKNTGALTVWKKIWYGRVDMAKAAPSTDKFEVPDGSIAIAVAAYQNVFIEMGDSGERQKGTYKENFDVVADAATWADSYTTSKYTPFKVVYSAVDVACPISGMYGRQTRTVTQNVTAVKQTIALPASFYPFDFNGGNWLVSATGTAGTTTATPVVKLPSGRRNYNSGLEVDFTGLALTPTAAAPVSVTISYYHAPGYNGWGGTDLHLIICRGIMEPAYGANYITAMGGTSTHEPGHALGLVKSPLAWETPDASHPTHCKVQKCVMWWQGYNARPSDFHTKLDDGTAEDPNCHTFLREKDMTRANMTIWKFPR